MCVFVVESSWWKCTTVSTVSPGNNKSLAEARSPPSPSHPHPPHLGSVGSGEGHRVCSTALVHPQLELWWPCHPCLFTDYSPVPTFLLLSLCFGCFVGFCLLAPNHYLDDEIQGWLSLFIHWSSPWVLLCFSLLSWSWRRGVCGAPPTHPRSPPMTPLFLDLCPAGYQNKLPSLAGSALLIQLLTSLAGSFLHRLPSSWQPSSATLQPIPSNSDRTMDNQWS